MQIYTPKHTFALESFHTNKYLCLYLYAAEIERPGKGAINYEDILLIHDVKSNHSGIPAFIYLSCAG